MEPEEKLEIFKEELDLIANSRIKEFTEVCIMESPDYVFEDCPSSSSGKYHPVEELGSDGTILHTKKVFALAYELSRALDVEKYRDEICAGALLHDLMKQGAVKSGHTVREHPQLMAKKVSDVYNQKFEGRLNKKSFLMIYTSIFFHYGPWTDKSVAKDLKSFSMVELAVYLADYVSSKRFVHVDHTKKWTLGV